MPAPSAQKQNETFFPVLAGKKVSPFKYIKLVGR